MACRELRYLPYFWQKMNVFITIETFFKKIFTFLTILIFFSNVFYTYISLLETVNKRIRHVIETV